VRISATVQFWEGDSMPIPIAAIIIVAVVVLVIARKIAL